jgi:hypothetical protein
MRLTLRQSHWPNKNGDRQTESAGAPAVHFRHIEQVKLFRIPAVRGARMTPPALHLGDDGWPNQLPWQPCARSRARKASRSTPSAAPSAPHLQPLQRM